jgi:hypothetical protein
VHKFGHIPESSRFAGRSNKCTPRVEWLVGRRYLSNHSLDAVLDEGEDNDREETRELTAA